MLVTARSRIGDVNATAAYLKGLRNGYCRQAPRVLRVTRAYRGRPLLRLIAAEGPRVRPNVEGDSLLFRAQSPEGRALLAAREGTPGASMLGLGHSGHGQVESYPA